MYIYAIGTDTKQKIGFSKHPEKRLKQLQTGNAEKLVLHGTLEVPDEQITMFESYLHRDLSYKRLQGEWFNMTKKEVIEYLTFAEITWLDDPLLKYRN